MVGSARAGQTVARSTDSGAHPAAVRSVSTVKPLEPAAAATPASGASRRIRHHPPANFDSCSTGYLQHGRTGLLLLFPPRNVQALAALLRELVENEEDRRRMGLAAAHEMRRRWLWEQLVPDMGIGSSCLSPLVCLGERNPW